MTKKDDLLDNNTDNKNSELNNKTNEFYSEKLTVGLYNIITSVVFNALSTSVVRNVLKTNSNILKLLELQISNLFFLESELDQELKDKKYSRNFLQVISDITELELSINKSPRKNRTEVLEDSNLLIVTIINSFKGVGRESLERIRTIDEGSFEELNLQISALNDFSSNETVQAEPEQAVNDLNSLNQHNNLNNNGLNPNVNLNNLTNLGLPQHPAQNPNFYPYLTKPPAVPKLRKLLIGAFALSILFTIMTIVTSFFVKGHITIDTSKGTQDFSLNQINNWITIVVSLFIFIWAMYAFAKPTKLKREIYHSSFFLLIVLAIWTGITVGSYFFSISDSYFQTVLINWISPNGTLADNVGQEIRSLPNFQLYNIFSIITASVSLLPILILAVLILINPRLDRNKVMKANVEYQNAIAAAMKGQKYNIDSSLFDNDEESNHNKQQKTQFTGRF